MENMESRVSEAVIRLKKSMELNKIKYPKSRARGVLEAISENIEIVENREITKKGFERITVDLLFYGYTVQIVNTIATINYFDDVCYPIEVFFDKIEKEAEK